jgi:hypothetical protein
VVVQGGQRVDNETTTPRILLIILLLLPSISRFNSFFLVFFYLLHLKGEGGAAGIGRKEGITDQRGGPKPRPSTRARRNPSSMATEGRRWPRWMTRMTRRRGIASADRVWLPRHPCTGQPTWRWKRKRRPNFPPRPPSWYANCGRCVPSASNAARESPICPYCVPKRESNQKSIKKNSLQHFLIMTSSSSYLA